MPLNITRILLLTLLLFSHLQLSYNFNQSWWHSAAGTAAVVLLGWLIWKKRLQATAGLAIPLKQLPLIFLSAAALALISFAVMRLMSGDNVLISSTGPKNYIHNFFYIINEEIVLGAIMLYLLTERVSLRPIFASAILALVVALAHLVLYKFYFRDKGLLLWSTVASLFLVAFAKNNLIIRTGHIGYAWAMHFGWMVVMYGCSHTHAGTAAPLSDLDKFNLYLGSPYFMLIAGLAAAATSLVPLHAPVARGSG